MATTISPATTATPAASGSGITKALGVGSGVDTAALVKSLVDAQFAGKTARLTRQSDTLTSQISSLAEIKSGITGFAGALTALTDSGVLGAQPNSSDAAVRATTVPGARSSQISASVNVTRLATAQVAVTRDPIAANARTGSGSLELRLGSVGGDGVFAWDGKAVPPIVITAADGGSLQSVADRITAAKGGITASVITDAGGQRLVLRGATGAAQAFTLTATPSGTDPGLDRLNVDFGGGTTGARVATRSGNAELTIDGIALSSTTNDITGAIPGVRLELQGLTPGNPATISARSSPAALTEAVGNLVATYNEMSGAIQKATDPRGGALRGDPAARALQQSLSRLTLAELTPAIDGSPRTLAQIGVATNPDGTLRIDKDLLAKALATWPDAVEAMFAPATGADRTGGTGLSARLNKIAVAASSVATGLGASEARYADAKKTLGKEQTRLTDQSFTVTTRMTQQFAASEARVAAYKAQQTFMENQIKMWQRDG